MEGNITHTAITSYGYGTLPLKVVPTNWGLHLCYTTYSFRTIFLVNFVLPSGNLLHMPPIFDFHDPLFTTHLRDSISQLNFVTHLHDSISQLHFMTHLHNSILQLHFMTPLRDPHFPSIPTLTLT